MASYQKSCPRLIKEYGFFASAYTKAIAVLESPKLSKEFVAFCNRSRQNPANKGLSLSDYLIKPIQRICKYPLLFRELLHHLTDDHPQAVTAKTVQVSFLFPLLSFSSFILRHFKKDCDGCGYRPCQRSSKTVRVRPKTSGHFLFLFPFPLPLKIFLPCLVFEIFSSSPLFSL